MANPQSKSIPRDQFLTMAINLLHRAFIESPRTNAKNLYRRIAEGETVPLTKVRMEDQSVVEFDIALDHSEFGGRLNYSAFRASLATLLAKMVSALEQGEKFPTFSSQGDKNNMIIGITGVTEEDGVPAVMVLSVQVDDRRGAVLLKPMYLDYAQFQRSQQQG